MTISELRGRAWKQLAGTMFAPLRLTDRSWYSESVRQFSTVIDAANNNKTASKILRSCLPGHRERIPAPAIDESPGPAWSKWPAAAQRHLVLRLGVIACGPYLRHSINKCDLETIAAAVDADVHREALNLTEPLVYTDLTEDYLAALEAKSASAFFAAVGLGVIATTVPQTHRFLLYRLRYLLPQAAWRARQQDLACNETLLIAILNEENRSS